MLNILLLKKKSFHIADDIMIYIFEFVLRLHMQFSYFKWIGHRRLQNIGPIFFSWTCLTRCDRDNVTSILKMTFSISFLTSGESWIWYENQHTWNWIWRCDLKVAAMLYRLQCFEGRQDGCPFQDDIQINFLVWNCLIIFSNLISMQF